METPSYAKRAQRHCYRLCGGALCRATARPESYFTARVNPAPAVLLLPPHLVPDYSSEIAEINDTVKLTLRLITFDRRHLADHLLDAYLDAMHDLQELLSVKNAQIEAQDEAEAEEYVAHMRRAMEHVMAEIAEDRNFGDAVQLFRLFRLVSPEAHAAHPNRYRDTVVQIGRYVCPPAAEINGLVGGILTGMRSLQHPILRAVYFHHELIRVHPFSDGNGRVTRVAKNWMLMYDLYPPIYINTGKDKLAYISGLAASFAALEDAPERFGPAQDAFFRAELQRLRKNASALHETVVAAGIARGG